MDGVATTPDGRNIAVRGNTGATLLMHIAVPAALENGDVLSVLQGCQKRFIDCKAYGNQDFGSAGSRQRERRKSP
jgi:hypothetical protein